MNICFVEGFDWSSFRTGYYTQVPEISGKLNKTNKLLEHLASYFAYAENVEFTDRHG
jgi:hypothetical protein